jgi:NADH-quinone oxidoreductase subunit F
METPLTRNILPGSEPFSIDDYERRGGYKALRKVLEGMSPLEVQKEVTDSGLRGRGGAGFSTGTKWSGVHLGAGARRPKYFLVNADEMEPGTFKDRLLLEGDPHQLVEGAVIASYAIEADLSYIFLRWDYKLAARRVSKAITEAYQKGFLGKNILGSGYNLELYLHESSGRYMCGEESGLFDALEGKRAIPRSKPPYAVTSGVWGKPTVLNNVETIANVPHIIANGPDWFKGLSKSKDSGTKLYSVCGKVKIPGVWELPMGTVMREIIEDRAGGMQEGFRLRGLLPGGASTDFLLEEHLDAPMDFDSMMKAGSRLGTGGIIILDDKTCPVGMVHNLMAFFSRESCGWCTPCRDGLPWAEKLLEAIETGSGKMSDLDHLAHICRMCAPGHTFCMLAPGAVEPLQSALKYFREDFERHIVEHKCPLKKG